MKLLTFAVTLLLLNISFPTLLSAAKVEVEGKAWLDSQKNPAEINVNGVWDSEDWDAFSPESARRKPGSERERRGIRDRRRSQRQALVPAVLRKPHCGLLRNPESYRRKQHGWNLFKSQVAAALRALPGKEQTDEHEKAVSDKE